MELLLKRPPSKSVFPSINAEVMHWHTARAELCCWYYDDVHMRWKFMAVPEPSKRAEVQAKIDNTG